LGGKPANQAVVNDFVWRVKAAELLSVLSPMGQDIVERR
jgi:hypothetical protein